MEEQEIVEILEALVVVRRMRNQEKERLLTERVKVLSASFSDEQWDEITKKVYGISS